LCIFDLHQRAHVGTIDLRPLVAPHTLKLGPDRLIYITCENSAKVAVIDPATNKVVEALDSGSTNGHRLIIAPDGSRLYTENEEDATVSVIDLPARKLLGKIKTPRPLAGIAISADDRTVVAVDDAEPKLILIDTEAGRVRDEVVLEGVPKAAQIARYAPDNSLLAVTSLNSDTVSLVEPSFTRQTTIKVGSQPMDMAFRGDELFVACQGDGSVHVIDIPNRRAKSSFSAGTGCESLGFF
jgi:DNA-binding beta-propeller fold protein YncE